MSSHSAELHTWRFPVDEHWIPAANSIERTPRVNARDDPPYIATANPDPGTLPEHTFD
jgi:hypothetical protein